MFLQNLAGSGYFGALVVFLVFFGEDLSFIPGLLLGENVDWSLRYFSVPPAAFALFYSNPILPAVGLLFAGLISLRRYLSEAGGAWLFLTALFFAALVEVKIFTAAQLMASHRICRCCLSCFFPEYPFDQNRDVHRCSGNTINPLGFSSEQKCGKYGHQVRARALCVPGDGGDRNERLVDWLDGFRWRRIASLFIGSLGLRLIGVPALFNAIFRPNPTSALRFVLAVFVVIGTLIALMFSITPAGWTFSTIPSAALFSSRPNMSRGSLQLKFFKVCIGGLLPDMSPRRWQRREWWRLPQG